jgi:transcriptional regulator with XRE-family HTH domain
MRMSVKARTHAVTPYDENMPKIKTLRQVVGENAKAIRSGKNLTQQDVVDAGRKKGGRIDQTTVGRIERCVHPTTVDSLDTLAKGLGVHPWELLIPDGTEENFLAVLKAWTQANDAGRTALGIVAEGILRKHEYTEQQQSRQTDAAPERSRAGGR